MLQIEDHGECGPQLIFLHGWGTNNHIWKPLLPFLSSHFRCRLIEYTQAGALLNDIEHFNHQLRTHIEPHSVAIGWSLGGLLAQAFHHQYPDHLKHVCLLGASPYFLKTPTWPYGICGDKWDRMHHLCKTQAHIAWRFFLKQYLHTNLSAADKSQLHRWQTNSHLPDAAHLLSSLALLQKLDFRSTARKITNITYMLGEHDPLVPAALAQWLPPQRTVIVPKTGHLFFWEHPFYTAQCIAQVA